MHEVKKEVRHLWELCFEDSPEFMDLYFRARYRDELNEYIWHEDHVVSALQLIPYQLTSWQNRFPMAYVSGVCTHPEARHQGFMRRLLTQAHRRLYREGCPLASLIPAEPWLFDCYAVSGYAPVFDYGWERLTKASMQDCFEVSDYRDAPSSVYEYFNRKMAERTCCVQHDEADFQIIMDDLVLSGGRLWVARRGDRVVGMAFSVPYLGECRFNECLADSPEIRQVLVNTACERGFARYVDCLHPVYSDTEGHRLGMLRIVHAEEVLTVYARTHPEVEACWCIIDADIPENNACFRLERGRCTKYSVTNSVTSGFASISIGDLAWHLWKAENPYMSLMLN